MKPLKILLVNPETPSTFWSFRHALQFVSRDSSEPPLGLLTIAAMLPQEWEKRLIDLNVTVLRDKDIAWADYVFLTGMNVHKASFMQVVQRCNKAGVKVVAGGPMSTTERENLPGVDHFVLNEAEITLPMFLNDLQKGCPAPVYACSEYPDLSVTPPPMWQLLDMKKYASMSLQYSRGCPFDCEFCSITLLNGRRPRTKSPMQFLAELESLYQTGWRGSVFIVDDNFIGNKKQLKAELLPALIQWSDRHGRPFSFFTEASINLADDDELLLLMASAGFDHIFIGIESTNDKSLEACGKKQNLQRDMMASVRKMHRHGLRVSGGFIVGFDQDPPEIFDEQIRFIQESGIVTAMVGLLNAPTGTKLFRRLQKENRLTTEFTGNNMDGSINFIPKMNYQHLMDGYKKVLTSIYSQKAYYERVKLFLSQYHRKLQKADPVRWREIKALIKSIVLIGIFEKKRHYYWKLFFLSLFKYPGKFPLAITLAVYGFHFRRVAATI